MSHGRLRVFCEYASTIDKASKIIQ
jgi:hypothetical protein